MTSPVNEELLQQFDRALAFSRVSLTELVPECVYHYTTAHGFAGILNDRAIRATNFSFLNDPSEVLFGRSLVEAELASLAREASPVAGSLIAGITRNLTIETVAEVYVACFSSLEDDLSQWRAYGTSATERYAIGFDAPTLQSLARQHSSAMYSKVLYRHNEQKKRVEELLHKAITFVESQPAATQPLEEYAAIAAKHLARLLPVVKHPAYEHEAEWRLIIWHRPGDQSPAVEASRGVLRPYVRFALDQPPSVVAVNVMAPARRDAALKASAILLETAEVQGVTPQHSKIPFAE